MKAMLSVTEIYTILIYWLQPVWIVHGGNSLIIPIFDAQVKASMDFLLCLTMENWHSISSVYFDDNNTGFSVLKGCYIENKLLQVLNNINGTW